MSNLVVDTLTNQDVQLCKAWVNFNGTGTVAIRASYNVSSITDNGKGDYTVNFLTAMPDINYGTVLGGARLGGGSLGDGNRIIVTGATLVSSVQALGWFAQTNPTAQDFAFVNLSIFR